MVRTERNRRASRRWCDSRMLQQANRCRGALLGRAHHDGNSGSWSADRGGRAGQALPATAHRRNSSTPGFASGGPTEWVLSSARRQIALAAAPQRRGRARAAVLAGPPVRREVAAVNTWRMPVDCLGGQASVIVGGRRNVRVSVTGGPGPNTRAGRLAGRDIGARQAQSAGPALRSVPVRADRGHGTPGSCAPGVRSPGNRSREVWAVKDSRYQGVRAGSTGSALVVVVRGRDAWVTSDVSSGRGSVVGERSWGRAER